MPFPPKNPVAALSFACAASLLSLVAAFGSQFVFGLMPCELCQWQRAVYALVIVLCVLGLAVPRRRRLLVVAVGLAFLGGAGLAGYHAAVEKGWVQGPTACTSQPHGENDSLDDFRRRIEGAPIVACDQPQWQFHGVTLAGLNAVWSLLLAAFVFAALQQKRRAREE